MDMQTQVTMPPTDNTSGYGPSASSTVSLEELALVECRKLAREAENRICFWSELRRRSPACPKEQLDEAGRQAEKSYNDLEARRSIWEKEFPGNNELTGRNSHPAANTISISSSSALAVPGDLPCLHVPGAMPKNAKGKILYPSAESWAYAFESSIQLAGLTVEGNFWRLLKKALDAEQHAKVIRTATSYLKENPDQMLTWQVMRHVIVQLYDSPVRDRCLVGNSLNCVQHENESMTDYVQRFQSTLDWKNGNERGDFLLKELFLDSTTVEWQHEAASWPIIYSDCDWPNGLDEILRNAEADDDDDDTAIFPAKYIHDGNQDTCPSREVKRRDDKQDIQSGRLPSSKSAKRNWCHHCLKHGSKAIFSRKHQCPYYHMP